MNATERAARAKHPALFAKLPPKRRANPASATHDTYIAQWIDRDSRWLHTLRGAKAEMMRAARAQDVDGHLLVSVVRKRGTQTELVWTPDMLGPMTHDPVTGDVTQNPKHRIGQGRADWWIVDKSNARGTPSWTRVGYFESRADAVKYGRGIADREGYATRIYQGRADRMPS